MENPATMTDHSPISACPDCGTPLPPDSPQALCPACLMRQALASRTIVEGDPQANSSPPFSPEEIAGKFPGFEILECLGRGGMGVVYKARQKSLNRIIAIKILAPERGGKTRFAGRFAREAEFLAKLNHPHIVTIHDFGETAGLFYLVMEFVDGVNLRDLLRDGKLEAKQALAIVPPICDALQYAHDKGIVHRDIKPENLLLDREGRIKIADFGISALMGTDVAPSGTPPYMAPEQCGVSPEVDNRADIYALGVVLYEMLTGERPNKELIAPSKKVHIDVRLDEIVLRALEKTPELRYQTAGIFKTQVETIVSEMASAAVVDAGRQASEQPKPAPSQPPVPGVKSNQLGKFAVGFFIGAVVGSPLLWGFMGSQEVIVLCGLAMVLSLVFGVMSWRSKSGKFAALASGLGLLLLIAFTSNYRTVPLTIEVAGTSRTGETAKPSASFGEVVERDLILGEKEMLRGLYLESGNLTSLNEEERSRVNEIEGGHKSRFGIRDWFDSKQLDIAISSWGDNFRIVGAEGRFALNTLPAEKWETATYTDVSNAVALETIIMARTKRKFAPTLVSSDGLWAFCQIHPNPQLPITYAMRCDDKLGLLQITARMQNPPGIKLRYKLLKNDAVDQIVPSIYGRELGNLKCFDFESNRFHSPPEALADELLSAVNREQTRKEVWHRVSPALIEWLEKTGVDVVAASYDSGAELLFINRSHAGQVALPLKGSLGEIDPSQAPLKPTNRRPPEGVLTFTRTAYLGSPRVPRNEFFPFQTREGNRGVLQVTGITADPFRGVKIRYKLVQTASHSDPIADPAASDTSAVDGSWGDHFKNGEIRRSQNKLEDSLASYRLSLAVVQAEMKRRPQDAAWQTVSQRRNKQSLTRIGDVLCAQGDHAGALENYRAAMASIEPLVRKVPTDQAQRNELAALYVKIGDVLDAAGDKAGALAAFRKAQEVDFPNSQTWEETFKSIGGDYNPATAFKPDELRQLAANPKSHGDFRRLMWLINRSGAEKDAGFRYLLDKPELRKNEEVNLALIGYDYSVNGNPKALDELLAKLAKEKVGSDSSVVVALSFIDEWDRVPKVVKAHFSEADGAGGTSQASYKLRSAYFFPRNSMKHEGKAGEGAPVNLNQKMDKSAAPEHEKNASLPPAFGPVIERMLPALAAGKACLLDLDTGEFHTPPDDLAESLEPNSVEKAELTRASLRWLRESRVEVTASPVGSDMIQILGAIMIVPWGEGNSSPGFDDMTPAIVLQTLSGSWLEREINPNVFRSFLSAGLGTHVFITPEGAMGVMEIPAGKGDPAGVKIRYKLLRGAKPGAEAIAAAKATWDLPPVEPVKELKIPMLDLPDGTGREGYRLTVEPGDGDYVLATLKEYEGHDTAGEDTPVKHATNRLLRVPGNSHSEDIFLDSHWIHRPSRENPSEISAITDRCTVSGFGQQIVVADLDFSGAPGSSAKIGDGNRSVAAWKRFKFDDYGGDKSRTRLIEFQLRVIRKEDALALAERHGTSLPDENVANWAITLADPRADPAAPHTGAADGSWGDHFERGEIRRAQQGLEDALVSYRHSLEAAQSEMKQRPQDTAWQAYGQRRIKKSHTRIGDVLCAQGDLAGALENYRAGRASIEPLVRQEPADEEQRRELTALYVKIGDVLQAQGDKAGALAAFRKAQEVDFPDFETWEKQFDESIGGSYNPTIPFKPEELRQLAAKPLSEDRNRDLERLILRAGAEKDPSFRYLLDQPELQKDEEVNLALIAYDYSVNGNPKALDDLLARLAKEKVGSDSIVVAALAFVDEWDRVPKAVNAHFVHADGSGGELKSFSEAWKAYLFPRNSLKHEGKAGEGAPVPPGDKR
jgi:tetratricopeptide (TPR) repeat protein/predicted Ser/Thr protein kinase